MTLKGIKKLLKTPHIFARDYIKKTKTEDEQKEILYKLIKLNIPFDKLYFFLAKEVSKKKKNTVLEKELLEKAYLISKKSEYLYKVANLLKGKKQWWQSAEAFSKAIELSSNPPKTWYKGYAEVLTQMNRHQDASQAWEKAIVGSKNANDWFLYGYSLELSNQNKLAEKAYQKAIEYDKDYNAKELGIGIFHEKRGHWIPASEAYKKKSLVDPLNPNLHYKLGLSLDRCYKWEEAENSFLKAIALKPENIDWYYRLGFVRERQEKFDEAAEAYRFAAENRKTYTPYWYYRLGNVLNKVRRYEESCDAFLMMKKVKIEKELPEELEEQNSFLSTDSAIDKENYNVEFLNSSFLQFLLDESNTKQDIIEYLKNNFNKTEDNIELWKLFFDENNYREKVFNYLIMEAEKAEREAEKAEREAEKAEREAEKASVKIELLERMIDNDTTKVKEWYQLAKNYMRLDKYNEAERALKNLIARKEEFDADLYFELGHILALQGKYEEASEMFKETRIMQSAHGVLETPYNKDKALQKIINYTEYYERFSLEENMVLYESYHGSSMSGNPYAIFKALFDDERFEGWIHIWVLNDQGKIPEELKECENIIFIKRESDLYMRYLAKAKYLINNVTFPEYFIRKEEQVYLNTWHGTPIKSLGKDIKDDFMAHKNVTRNFLQASHLIQPNRHTTNVLLDRYDVKDIFSGVAAETGYPRQDLMLNIDDDEKKELLNKLGVSEKEKVVLYAPTWRGAHGSAKFDTQQLEDDLSALSEMKNTRLLFRGHHMIEGLLQDLKMDVTVVPPEIDTNTLLSVVDVLITDYSSIAFDFMALERPIVYYAYDMDEYMQERGFYFSLEDISDNVCFDRQELLQKVETAIQNMQVDKKQKEAKSRFCTYDDGNATKRVIDLVFYNESKNANIIESNGKKTILLYGGQFMANGITTSFINLVNHIDKDKYNVCVCIDPNNVKSSIDQLKQFEKLDAAIKVIPRVGRMMMTLEEKWVRDKFESQNVLASQEMYDIYKSMHKKEYYRIFGENIFDAIVHFEGYNKFWEAILAINDKRTVTSIYQHNDMHGEWQLKYPKLEINFRLYHFYDHIVSVSRETMEHNEKNLSKLFEIDKNNFIYCDNVQNPEYIMTKAEEEIEEPEDEKIFENTKVFINIARLSPEKDQEKLIRAFAKIRPRYPEARLVILGQGSLEHKLKQLIRELGMHKKVFLLGQKFNPYPYLKKSSCFVLSSNHEGQPMTLLEALILDKPIIATDIVGNRSVLEGRPGHLVENSEEGLVEGMTDFLEGKYDKDEHFDYEVYNRNALEMFYEKVCGEPLNG